MCSCGFVLISVYKEILVQQATLTSELRKLETSSARILRAAFTVKQETSSIQRLKLGWCLIKKKLHQQNHFNVPQCSSFLCLKLCSCHYFCFMWANFSYDEFWRNMFVCFLLHRLFFCASILLYCTLGSRKVGKVHRFSLSPPSEISSISF